MKRFISFLSILVIMLTLVPTVSAASEQVAVKGSASVENVDRFLNIGDSVDISKGYVTAMLSNGKPSRTILKNDMLKNPPDTSKVGFYRSYVTIYSLDVDIIFMVLDENKKVSNFKDLYESFWGFESIQNCVRSGLFEGRSYTNFGIKDNMTRAEFCQVLYNIYKNDEVLKPVRKVEFSDLKKDAWYVNAVYACADAGIVSGMGDGTFNPDGAITRQDAVLMMMNVIYGEQYLENLDYDKVVAAARKKGIAATDIDRTSPYAKKAMAAALGVIVEGDSVGNLTPKNKITRAECAVIMSNYFFKGYGDKVVEPEPDPEPETQKLVYLSPSNQMSNQYANYHKNKQYTEGIQMQIVAEVARVELEKMGYKVFVADVKTSINDTNPYGEKPKEDGITSRAEEAAAMNADCYVAIHSNAAGKKNDGSAQGTRVFYNGENKGAKELATFIHDRVGALTPTKESKGSIQEDISYSKDHGQTPYAEVWRPKMANLILEVEFHDYEPYADWIVANTTQLGIEIAKGIDEYFKSIK